MYNVFLTPRKIVSGKDVLVQVGPLLKDLGNKALIVTDQIMVSTGNVQKLINVLKEQSIPYELFAEINSEPTLKWSIRASKYTRVPNAIF